GDIQIALNEGHRPSAEYVALLRKELPRRFPGVTFSFLPAEIVSQILNFGSPSPVEVQVRGADLKSNYAFAEKVVRKIKQI
ncbi:hypothetical protein ABTK27_19375, partial [Acinetobacter baumannii]